MALRKTGALADSVATPSGIKSKDGVMLVANDNTFYIHSKAFMDAWNGVKEEAPKYPVDTIHEVDYMTKEEIDEVVEEVVVEKPAKKKKVWSKKK
jgi:hypothetical protein